MAPAIESARAEMTTMPIVFLFADFILRSFPFVDCLG
jgi:hypothetical protein